ncbi:hypothetical protein DL96DRAFT_1551702 [Flagelloscypha sp. PMI_526]|nr:hypothetical protein DL96DRAFT_1551702 [Flagelloscypha sp. PMI_526]
MSGEYQWKPGPHGFQPCHGPIPRANPGSQRPPADHIPRDKVPNINHKMKTCIELLYRVLSNELNPSESPKNAEETDLDTFAALRASMDDVKRAIKEGQSDAKVLKKHCRDMKAKTTSDVAAARGNSVLAYVLKLKDVDIVYAWGAFEKVGLPKCKFDWEGTGRDAEYHQVLERTFALVFSTIAGDHEAVVSYLRNFVWGHLYTQYKNDLKSAGTTKNRSKDKGSYNCRVKVKNLHVQHMEGSGFPKCTLAAILENECHSDDEQVLARDNTTVTAEKRYIRHDKVVYGCNPNWRFFFDQIDKQIIQTHDTVGASARVPSHFPCTPAHQSLDWWDPAFFNKLAAQYQAYYLGAPIAFPLPEDMTSNPTDWASWKSLSDEEFEQQYGARVCALYQFPTKEEMNNAGAAGYGPQANPGYDDFLSEDDLD